MSNRNRWRGTTTERGYGWDHVRERNRRLAQWQPGDRCARCGQPMWSRWTYNPRTGKRESAIDLGHTADRTAYIGLEHRFCNRQDGGRRLHRMRLQWAQSRQW